MADDVYYSFTRDELVDALTRVQTVTLVKGGAGVINAESMADALIEALAGTPVPVHYHWPVACGDFSPGELWTGNLDRVTCAACLNQCPECRATSGTVLCDGCKFETCRSCGWRCACGEYKYDVAPEPWPEDNDG